MLSRLGEGPKNCIRDAFRATSSEIFMPQFTALLAGACEIAGQIEEAVTLLDDDALQIVERTGESRFAAELNRHKGQLLLRQGNSRGTLSRSPEYRPRTGGQALGTARHSEPRPAAPRSGPARRSLQPSRAGIRLVH